MIAAYRHWRPVVSPSAFIAHSAEIIGRVTIAEDANIWYQSVLRGDVHDIRIGRRSNIQDHCVLHTSSGVAPCVVGDDVTVGHRVILHGCEVEDGCLIGMGAIIMDRARVEAGSLVAAGSLVPEGKVLRSGFVYAGVPAREKRPLTDEEKSFLADSAAHYVALAETHRNLIRML